MVSLKDRRNSGKYTPKATCSSKELKQNNLFIDEYYDDWEDHRDGSRDWFRDGKMIKVVPNYINSDSSFIKRVALNKKQEMLLRRRKARKKKLENFI